MITPNLRGTSKDDTFRLNPQSLSNGGEVYGPTENSALTAANQMARGEHKDERNPADIKKHKHDGKDALPIPFRSLSGYIPTVSVAPTVVSGAPAPRKIGDQFKIYVNGMDLRLYVYDVLNGVWHYVTLT